METPISNAFDIDADDVEEGDDALTSLQKVRMKEARATCPRCRQGFCADHGTKLGAYKERPVWAAMTQLPDEEEDEDPRKEELGLATDEEEGEDPQEYEQRECKNNGCGKRFTEKENHSSACHYHLGPVSFSDRSTGEHKVHFTNA